MAGALGISPEAMQHICGENQEDEDSDGRSLCRPQCLIVDCRPFIAFNSGHIIGALNVHCPPIIKRRSGGSLQLQNVINSDQVRSQMLDGQYSTAVFYDERTMDVGQLTKDSIVLMAIKVVRDTGKMPQIYFLQGGYETFSRHCGHLCSTGQLPNISTNVPTICITRSPTNSPGLIRSTEKLAIADGTRLTTAASCLTTPETRPPGDESVANSSSSSSSRMDLLHPQQHDSARYRSLRDQGDPVPILPWLYIGNSYHSTQEERLTQLGINAKLNVAGQQPSLSYAESRDFRCMSIPVTDTSTENISSWFPTAIEFIEKVRLCHGKVLVHCQAGISRSATICIAYLMHHRGQTLDEAYDFIQARRSVISPNMNFMRQLAEYEKQLSAERKRANKFFTSSSSCQHRRTAISSLSSVISRLQRPCRCHDLVSTTTTSTTTSGSSFFYCGRHSSPSVLVASPYLDQRHAGKSSRRHRRSSVDLGLQLHGAFCRMTSTFDTRRWSEQRDDDGVFHCPSRGTPGILLPFNCSSSALIL